MKLAHELARTRLRSKDKSTLGAVRRHIFIAKVLRTVVPQTMLLARKKISKMNPIAFQWEINLFAKGTS